ncbi:MAG: FKBP-type peptidyl-prolyl cis-trans isomerase [Flavobacteriales bacterium]|nr:FKBP-type peptidyl-prolyl cis-trans isomerase [Flavobacteriales bacterium]
MSNKVISLSYTLTKDTAEGELIESTEGKDPLVFLSGVGQMIPDFEANVVDLGVGEAFSFGIKAAAAYGERSDDAIIELEKDMFMDGDKLADGIEEDKIVPLQDQHGRVVPAKVVKINEATVTMDVNHPLAGQDLHFTGTIIEVRPATEDEISHGHVHGPGGHHH